MIPCDSTFVGTVGDLYKALAEACSLSAAKPEHVLLLVEIVQGQVNRKYTDLQEPLADAICRQSLLAYHYPTDAAGPASGGKELHVFQRSASQQGTLKTPSPLQCSAIPRPTAVQVMRVADRPGHKWCPGQDPESSPASNAVTLPSNPSQVSCSEVEYMACRHVTLSTSLPGLRFAKSMISADSGERENPALTGN